MFLIWLLFLAFTEQLPTTLISWIYNVIGKTYDSSETSLLRNQETVSGVQQGQNVYQLVDISGNQTYELPSNDKDALLLELSEEEWWEVEQTNDHIFNQFKTSSIYLRFADLDENGLHSCYEYKVIDNQLLDKTTHYGTFCYPAIVVTGARKCSTSAMVSDRIRKYKDILI
jgi:hypothetical protein